MDFLNDINTYYSEKIKTFGATARGVDWNSEKSQTVRFRELLKIVMGSDSFNLLDFGCGYGALFDYMKGKYPEFNYSGYDISNEMLIRAKELHGESSLCQWENKLSDKKYDYIIASGIFNVRLNATKEVWEKFIIETLCRLNQISNKGFSFNMLTSYSDEPLMKEYLYYGNPCFYFDYCKMNFSKNIALLHDYELYEFSILVKK